MSHVETLSRMFQDVQLSGKFERNEILAVLAILKDMAERLEKVERGWSPLRIGFLIVLGIALLIWWLA